MYLKKNKGTNTWFVQFSYTNWYGERKSTTKRGFCTKSAAETWTKEFLEKQEKNLNMRFEQFLKLYYEDMESRLKESTRQTKRYIINQKILPYFGNKPINDITVFDIRAWQNHLLQQNYSETYLKTINNQLSAIFNFASRYYELKNNPCKKAGSIGKGSANKMAFWTKAEYLQFVDVIKDKPISYLAFQILYWTGIRTGELLALSYNDIDFENRTISISKSYQRLYKKDVITSPKTPKSNRIVNLPQFLIAEIQECAKNYQWTDGRIFDFTKHFLRYEMIRGAKKAGVKKIRLHDLRHSHASLLVEMGVSVLEIAERLGHERIETTLNTYSHLYPNKQAQLAVRLNAEFLEKR